MKLDGRLQPLDESTTEGTTRPRWLANSSAHRATLIRRGLLARVSSESDLLTEAGTGYVAEWLEAEGKTVDDYTLCVSDELSDRAFHLPSYAITLLGLGGEATDREVLRARERLFMSFSQLQTPTAIPTGLLSASHVQNFCDLGMVRIIKQGRIRLTSKGSKHARRWLIEANISERDLTSIASKRGRGRTSITSTS